MKKPIAIVLGASCLSIGLVAGAIVANAASGTPEIDRANAKISVQGQTKAISCVGEDGVKYLTYSGAWKGSESQVVPDPTDYPLSGPLYITGIKWTINTKTLRGVLTAKITLASSAGVVYSGALILVSQGAPGAGAPVAARGWINANFKLPDEGATPGDDNLIANVEFKLSPTAAFGEFGDLPGTFSTPNFSVVTNVAPTAADGTC